jgi:hypothetical protein
VDQRSQEDAFPTEPLHQHLDLSALKLDQGLLMPIDPTSQNDYQELPRLQDEVHDPPTVRLEAKTTASARNHGLSIG